MPNERLLLALDLDGSLLTDDKMITDRTQKALNMARQQGHIVVISTGRPYRASKVFYDLLQLDTPIVNFNGALVHHPLNNNWGHHHFPLDLPTAQSIIKMSNTFGVQNVMIEILDDVYVKNNNPLTLNTFYDLNLEINELPTILKKKPTSLLIHPYEHNVSTLREMLQENHAEVIEHRKWNAPWHVIEIVRSGLNKAVGLQLICDHFNIPAKNVIAFGDEDNDFEMIEFAGTGVAMGNAIPLLKEVANAQTLTNQEDGIAHFLEKNVL